MWLLLDLYLALRPQVLSDTKAEESLRACLFVLSHPCEPIALRGAGGSTAADWQSGNHSTLRQKPVLTHPNPSNCPFGSNLKDQPQVKDFFSSWIPLLHV